MLAAKKREKKKTSMDLPDCNQIQQCNLSTHRDLPRDLLRPQFFKKFYQTPPSPRSKNFENFPTSNSNNSITTRSFEILKTQLNPAYKDEQIGNFSFFLIPFPDLDKRVESVNLAYFSRKLLVNCSYS